MKWLLVFYLWLELWTLIELGSRWSAGAAMVWVLAAAVLGLGLIRRVGRTSVTHLWQVQQTGALSRQLLLGDFSTALAGLLLLIPGLISDVFAVIVLLGPLRRMLRQLVGGAGGVVAASGEVEGETIEGEYRTISSDQPLESIQGPSARSSASEPSKNRLDELKAKTR